MITKAIGTASAQTGSERPQFFARSALIMAVIVVPSFPVTYYLPLATGSGKFDTLHHLHGLAFFAWFGRYVWQTRLVVRGHVARHREVGLIGFALTGLMIRLGFWMAQRGAQRRLRTMEHPYEFTWYNLVDITLFAVLMIAAIVLVTRHKEWHRRFAFAAALCLVAPAATRWTLRIPGVDPFVLDIAAYVVMYPFLIALALFDWRAWGKLHPATLTSIALLLPLHVSGAWIARSSWWNAVAPGLIVRQHSQVHEHYESKHHSMSATGPHSNVPEASTSQETISLRRGGSCFAPCSHRPSPIRLHLLQ